jgi:hypothetical protein
VRWALAQIPQGKNAPESVTLRAVPPGLRLDATVSFMGNRLETSAILEVEGVRLGADSLGLVLRVRNLSAKALTPNTPIAQVLASGALDLTKPANMLNFIGKRPPIIVEAKGDRFELDLLQVPKLRDNRALRRVLATAAPVVGVTAVRTEGRLAAPGLEADPHRDRRGARRRQRLASQLSGCCGASESARTLASATRPGRRWSAARGASRGSEGRPEPSRSGPAPSAACRSSTAPAGRGARDTSASSMADSSATRACSIIIHSRVRSTSAMTGHTSSTAS